MFLCLLCDLHQGATAVVILVINIPKNFQKTQKSPEFFANILSLLLNKIVFVKVKNSIMENILGLGI